MTYPANGYVALPTDNHESELALGQEVGNHVSVLVTNGTFTVHPGSGGYSYAYGPSGFQGLLHNYYTLLSAVLASIGGLLFGYDQGVIANVLVMNDFRARWAMTDWQEGVMTAMLELGALVGALLAGALADRHSRRVSIFTACVIFIIGSLFQCGAQAIRDLIIGRTIGGLGIGSLSMLSPLYLAEISPPEVRGSLMALEQLAIVLGVVLGFWTGYTTREYEGSTSWRLPLAIQIIPAIILAVGCLVLPPSPRLLIIQGKNEEALSALARLRLRKPEEKQTDPLLRIEYLEMQVEAELISRSEAYSLRSDSDNATKNGLEAELRCWMRLFQPKYRERVMIGVAMMFFQQWSGINALIYYGPHLMERIGLEGDIPKLIGSGGIGIAQLLAVVPAIIYIDRLGRKPLLQWGGLVMGGAHLLVGLLVLCFQTDWASHHFAAWAAVGCVYVFTAAYGFSYGPIAWILPSEVLPLSIRSRGAALATMSVWTNNFVIGLVTPVLLSTSPATTFFIFSVACVSAVIWSRKCVPETAGVSLEEIDKMFSALTNSHSRSRSSSDSANAATGAGGEEEELRREIANEVGLEKLIQELSAGAHIE